MTEASNLRFIIRRRDEQITALRENLELAEYHFDRLAAQSQEQIAALREALANLEDYTDCLSDRCDGTQSPHLKAAHEQAIQALAATEPEACEHDWVYGSRVRRCRKCGVSEVNKPIHGTKGKADEN